MCHEHAVHGVFRHTTYGQSSSLSSSSSVMRWMGRHDGVSETTKESHTRFAWLYSHSSHRLPAYRPHGNEEGRALVAAWTGAWAVPRPTAPGGHRGPPWCSLVSYFIPSVSRAVRHRSSLSTSSQQRRWSQRSMQAVKMPRWCALIGQSRFGPHCFPVFSDEVVRRLEGVC